MKGEKEGIGRKIEREMEGRESGRRRLVGNVREGEGCKKRGQ